MKHIRNKLQQSNQVSQEELAKTQVLNLSDVQEIAKYERKTSKKPAIFFAAAGILSITLGLAYPNIMTAIDSAPTRFKPNSKSVEIDSSLIQNKIQENRMKCVVNSPSNLDGTAGVATYNYVFDEMDKLQSYTMVLEMMPQLNNVNGALAIPNHYNVYAMLDPIKIEGYKITSTLNNDTMKVIANVDLTKLNKQALTPNHLANTFSNVTENLNDDKNVIQQQRTSLGYTCE